MEFDIENMAIELDRTERFLFQYRWDDKMMMITSYVVPFSIL